MWSKLYRERILREIQYLDINLIRIGHVLVLAPKTLCRVDPRGACLWGAFRRRRSTSVQPQYHAWGRGCQRGESCHYLSFACLILSRARRCRPLISHTAGKENSPASLYMRGGSCWQMRWRLESNKITRTFPGSRQNKWRVEGKTVERSHQHTQLGSRWRMHPRSRRRAAVTRLRAWVRVCSVWALQMSQVCWMSCGRNPKLYPRANSH